MSNSENIQTAVEQLEEVQELMREAVQKLNSAKRTINAIEGGDRVSERLYRYILGHLEPLIDSEHHWLDQSTNIQNIVEEVERLADDYEEEEEDVSPKRRKRA